MKEDECGKKWYKVENLNDGEMICCFEGGYKVRATLAAPISHSQYQKDSDIGD
jgi:hypothetical protein